MERVDADDNPLSSSSRNNLALRAASRSDNDREHRHRPQQARSPTATLIQSAARSVLDNLTPSTIVSDDKSEIYSIGDDAEGIPIPASSPTLRSLQKEILPAIPDEQERRRFIVSGNRGSKPKM